MDAPAINKLSDVRAFIGHLYDNDKVAFHPDDDFADYINGETKQPLYSRREAEKLNKLMDKAFKVCQKYGVSLYGFCNVEYRLRFMEHFQ